MTDAETVVTATTVPEEKRMGFLPRLFGDRLIVGEATAMSWAATLSVDYQGGLWDFHDLSNGGGYMAPTTPERLRLQWADNHFDGVMSADAAGIVFTLYALNHLAHRYEDEAFVRLFHLLLDFAKGHPEARRILSVID
jgi:hypothetical protein